MEMIATQDTCFLFGKPLLNPEIRALGAHPVLAGVIPYAVKMAVRAGRGVPSQNGGAANHDAMGCFPDKSVKRMRLLIDGISDQKYRLNSCRLHSLHYVSMETNLSIKNLH